jgi:arsenite methyltransferase
VDVIISNCVINLSDDKPRALSEAYRVLKPSGRFAVADVVSLKDIPPRLRQHAEMWCGCLAADEYAAQLALAGFTDISIEPMFVYTRSTISQDFLEGFPEKHGISEADLDILDGAFAGALIRAVK